MAGQVQKAAGPWGGSRAAGEWPCLLPAPQVVLLRGRLAGLLDRFGKPEPKDLMGLMEILGDILHRLGTQGVGAASLKMAQHLLPLFEDVRAGGSAANRSSRSRSPPPAPPPGLVGGVFLSAAEPAHSVEGSGRPLGCLDCDPAQATCSSTGRLGTRAGEEDGGVGDWAGAALISGSLVQPRS